MARFVDLEMEDGPDDVPPDYAQAQPAQASGVSEPLQIMAPKNDTAMARALQCYPIAIAIVSAIDLNTLDSLARTNRSTYTTLIQFRGALISSTLRCTNEHVPLDPEQTLRFRARVIEGSTLTNVSKAGDCARDMVSECRRCATVICRNCAIKPPTAVALRERHRRICKTCAKASLNAVASPPLDAELPWSSDIFGHSLCNCSSGGVWLCQPCGRAVRSADNDYQAIWRWRVQYGESLGGLGTGIGDGDRGVICGKERECLAARYIEQEMDCDAEDAKGSPIGSAWSQSDATGGSYASSSSGSGSHSPNSYFPQRASPSDRAGSRSSQNIESLIDDFRAHDRTPSPLYGPGYERHEIEGIGGIVKRKIVRMVRVGACVPEWQDERSHFPAVPGSRVLGHEVRGDVRSWCGWCSRVVPGKKDLAEIAARDAARQPSTPISHPVVPMQTRHTTLPVRPAIHKMVGVSV